MVKKRSKNRQLAINMVAVLTTFVLGLGVRFFLSPYIISHLGREAYGFIGLASNILSYTALLTIALNSMAGRFISIRYLAGDVDGANRYYASVFFSNLVLAAIISLFAVGCANWLECFLEIPDRLLFDVKFLFCILALNYVVGLMTGTWGVATFIKNRIDLSSIRKIVGTVLKVAVLVLLFTFLPPRLWYVGVAGMVLTSYQAITNKQFCRILTPDLRLRLANYEWSKVLELLKAGVWNVISRLGAILGHGLDLLVANVCIGASEMGLFAITKNVPFLILSCFGTISGVFAPIFTQFYAQRKMEDLISEVHKSMRVLSFFVALPLAGLYVYGKEFYSLWIPTEDAVQLQWLTILGTFALPYTLPLESLWNIFTVTNKLKVSTLFTLVDNFIVFMIVIVSMAVVDSLHVRLIILACTRSVCGVIRGFVFLPMYGAHCLGFSPGTFYRTIFRSLICTTACFGGCFALRGIFIPHSWAGLALCGIMIPIVCFAISSVVILTKSDRAFIYEKIVRRK